MNTSPYPHLQQQKAKPVTITDLAAMKAAGEKIACLTAYDASFAALEERAGIDLILVGDSLGMVIQGHNTTVPVSVDDMVYHSRVTAQGASRPFLIADLPFLSYASPEAALDSARRLMQRGLAQMVKLEGGAKQAEVIEYLSQAGVPVCAHLGLRPQLVHKIGGFKLQGKDDASAKRMLEEAKMLEQAGADILLVECVPSALGQKITQQADVPVIGIGAGPDTDGQILVVYDVLGISPGRKPRFVQDFMQQADSIENAIAAYVDAVKSGAYPDAHHAFG